jgi:acetoin utilization deacetylase AcuC-like enzyme
MGTIKVAYSDNYFCEGYGVDTREKARDIAHSLGRRPIEGIELFTPAPATVADYTLAHTRRYAQAIATGHPWSWADRNGLGDWSRDLAESVAWSTGGVLAAVDISLATGSNAGSLSSGLHHARGSHGSGFCTINGLVVGARRAVLAGAARVLIVDFDVHCGGGTASLLRDDEPIEQIDVSGSSFDTYSPTATSRLWMTNGAGYLATIREALASVEDPAGIDLVIYNAGMDPHQDCPTGGVRGITTEVLREREENTFAWAKQHSIPVTFVLAGGYSGRSLSRDQLVDLHRLTLHAATM